MALPRLNRRQVLTAGLAGVGGLAVGATAASSVQAALPRPPSSDGPPDVATEAFHGEHQSGVMTPAQAHASFLAYDLRAGTDREALGRMMRLISDDAARLTQGRAALADTEPELAARPARLTVTFGFGPGLLAAAAPGASIAHTVRPLPAFSVDRLENRWSGGDLLLQVCCDDPTTLAHAERMLHKDIRAFATPRWTQRGFLQAPGAHGTPRNLLGQVDGTVNPDPDQANALVWVGNTGPEWLRGGTFAVVRRIRLDLDRWDSMNPGQKELVIGRRLSDGAPLTGESERDEPDLAATDASGLLTIPEFAHVRRARGDARGPQIRRRGYNYVDGPGEAGLVFVSYQADVAGQFVPIQRRLAELDLLNTWTTPIGSAVFAIPPGAPEGHWVGESLLV